MALFSWGSAGRRDTGGSPTDGGETARDYDWIVGFFLAGAAGFFFLLVFAAQADSFFRSLALGTFLAGASLAVGGLFGLLFGIPRSLQGERGGDEAGETAGKVDEAAQGARYTANTNLERLSDWLTGIIVGISLTQAEAIATKVDATATDFGAAMSATGGREMALAIIIYYAVSGFIFGFLWTRMLEVVPENRTVVLGGIRPF